MQEENIDPKQKCCLNCKYYEERTCFCRFSPPVVIPQYIKGIGNVTNAVWPKIPLPNIDWCNSFKDKSEKKLI